MIPHPKTVQGIIKEIEGRKPLKLHDGMLLIRLTGGGGFARAWKLPAGLWATTDGPSPKDSVKNVILWRANPDHIEAEYQAPDWEPHDKMLVTDTHSGEICKLQHRGTAWEHWPAHEDHPDDWAVHHGRWDISRLTLQELRDRFVPYTEEP